MNAGEYIPIIFSTLTLLVTAVGWYFTYRAQRSLADRQREHDLKKETRQNLRPARARQLDEIETWLSQTMPLAASLLQSPNDGAYLAEAEKWQVRVPALLEVARQHDPIFATLTDADRWSPNNPASPDDLPQLIGAIGTTHMDYLRSLRRKDNATAADCYMRLTKLHGHAYDALERVRRHAAASFD